MVARGLHHVGCNFVGKLHAPLGLNYYFYSIIGKLGN